MSFWGKLKRRNVYKVGAVYAIVAIDCLLGCTTVKVKHTETAAGPVEQGDGITVLLDNSGYFANRSTDEVAKLEAQLCDCVQKALLKADCPVNFIPSDELRRSLFPDMDSTEATKSIISSASLPISYEFHQKIDIMRLRYLVVVNEETSSETEPVLNDLTYSIGASITKVTSLNIRITDTKYDNADTLNIYVESDGYYGLVLGFVPVIKPAASKSKSCSRLGTEVVTYLLSGGKKSTVEER